MAEHSQTCTLSQPNMAQPSMQCALAPQELGPVHSDIRASAEAYGVLETAHYAVPEEAAEAYWQLQHCPPLLQDELAAARDRLQEQCSTHRTQLACDLAQLDDDAAKLQARPRSAQPSAQPCEQPAAPH